MNVEGTRTIVHEVDSAMRTKETGNRNAASEDPSPKATVVSPHDTHNEEYDMDEADDEADEVGT